MANDLNPFTSSGDTSFKPGQNMDTLGNILLEQKVITPEQLEACLLAQTEKDQRLGEIIIKKEFATEEQISRSIARQLDLPFYDKLPINDIDSRLVSGIPINFCKTNSLLPIAKDEYSCTVAAADPLNVFPLDDLRMLLESNITLVVAPKDVILTSINRVYERSSDTTQSVIQDLEGDISGLDDLEETRDLLDSDDEEAPIIRLVQSLLLKAVKDNASDIHIEPYEREVIVRFRVDGDLFDVMSPPKRHQSAIVSRVKILSKMNIAEKRLPQDGRLPIKVAGKDIDIRVNILPTVYGERIVMRLHDNSGSLLDLDQMGIPPSMMPAINKLITKKHGIILVTGPTGSGKTTTLYSMLQAINTPEKNIMTIEDPVEIQLPGIAQTHVIEKIGLTFAEGLRAILRQDPNVVLIGEIRDTETARIAVQASMTGHLVFSTVHTNDTAASIPRMVDLGIESYQITSSFIGILAVRLARTLCKNCKAKYRVTELDMKKYDLEPSYLGQTVYKAVGCEKCNNGGYSGQTGVYELLVVDDEIKQAILKSPEASQLKKLAITKGMIPLREEGFRRVLDGSTSFDEIMLKTQVDS